LQDVQLDQQTVGRGDVKLLASIARRRNSAVWGIGVVLTNIVMGGFEDKHQDTIE
jgi:hypothetical protein